MLKEDKSKPLNIHPDQKTSLPSEIRHKLGEAAIKLQEHALFPRVQTNDTTRIVVPLLDLGENQAHRDRRYYLYIDGTILEIPTGNDGRLLWDKRIEVEGDNSEIVKFSQIAIDAVEIRIESQRLDLLDE